MRVYSPRPILSSQQCYQENEAEKNSLAQNYPVSFMVQRGFEHSNHYVTLSLNSGLSFESQQQWLQFIFKKRTQHVFVETHCTINI